MVATTLVIFRLSSFNLNRTSCLSLFWHYTSSASSFPQHMHCSLITWPLRRCSPAAGSDRQSVSWHSSSRRPLACKADFSNLGGKKGWGDGGEWGGWIKELSVILSGWFWWAHMLRVLAACLSKQHEVYTEKSLAGQLSLGVKTETGHMDLTREPFRHLVKWRCIFTKQKGWINYWKDLVFFNHETDFLKWRRWSVMRRKQRGRRVNTEWILNERTAKQERR